MTSARRLSPMEYLLYPLLRLVSGPEQRAYLDRCAAMTRAHLQDRKAQRIEARLLEREARAYAEILVRAWARLGAMYAARYRYDTGPEAGNRRKRKRTDYVRFEAIITQSERIWYKVLIARRTLFGWKDMLPHRVTASELITDDALFNLTMAVERTVTAVHSHSAGLWVIVHRLEGIDGLPRLVRYRDVLQHFPSDASETGAVVLGVGENRSVMIASLAKQRHWLVGGAQGGGKSNEVNVIIASFMRFVHPHDMRLVLIDLKRVEFATYRDAPHLYCPPIFEPDEAIEMFEKMVSLIQERASLMAYKAKEISDWNRKYPEQHMPRIVLIVDEFAELTIGAEDTKIADKVNKLVGRISSLGRAVGIHLIVCTQRPSVEVISNRAKINMDLTLCARTQNSTQSQTILGVGDAANLPLLPGRMLALTDARLTTIQTPLIEEDDIIEAMRIARGRGAGVITLDGWQPTIDTEGLMRDIVIRFGGRLHSEKLAAGYADMAITRKMLKPWLAKLIKEQSIKTARGLYEVHKDSEGYYLLVTEEYPPDPVEEVQPAHEPIEIVIDHVPTAENGNGAKELVPVQRDRAFTEEHRRQALATWREIRKRKQEELWTP